MNAFGSLQTSVTRGAGRSPFVWHSAAGTSKGNVRPYNEDAVLELPEAGVWVVADGMGGHEAGDVASAAITTALASVRRHAQPSVLVDEVEDRLDEVNDSLYRESVARGAVIGSTVAMLIALERHVIGLWAGDSRIYSARKGVLAQLTRDHSEIQQMIDDGLITPAAAEQHAAANVITRAVGGAAELFLDIELAELRDGDSYLLCTDGLYRELSGAALARALERKNPDKTCDELMRAALAGPCRDNVSAVIVRFSAA
jgi:serine/threonine protein phosphatase PrpC